MSAVWSRASSPVMAMTRPPARSHCGRMAPPPVLTFQVTTNLERDTTVEIEVLDARTGVRLGGAEAVVAAKIVVEDDL